MDYYAYTLVTDNPIVVDFSGCKYLDDLHERIRKSFGFPACCGKNWDAVWDCIDGYFDENESRTIQIRGFQSMPNELQEYCKPMWGIFSDLQKEFYKCYKNPNFLVVTIIILLKYKNN